MTAHGPDVLIITTLTKQFAYRISVSINGQFSHDLTATLGTVLEVRNKEAERWTAQAATVTALPIPTQAGHEYLGEAENAIRDEFRRRRAARSEPDNATSIA